MGKEVGLVEGLKTIYEVANEQGAFDSVKAKLFNKARIPLATAALMTGKAEDQVKGLIKDKVPEINVGTKLGGDKGFYADASAGGGEPRVGGRRGPAEPGALGTHSPTPK